MAGNLRFKKFRSARQIGFLKIGGGFDKVQAAFRWYPSSENFSGCSQHILNRRQRAVGQMIGDVKLAEPKARVQISGTSWRTRSNCATSWRNKLLRAKGKPVGETKAGVVERPVGVEHFAPSAEFAELVERDCRQIHGCGFAGAKLPVEVQIDSGDGIVGIQFLRRSNSAAALVQFARALQLHAPKIQAARIKIPGDDGVLVGFGFEIQLREHFLPERFRRIRVGRRQPRSICASAGAAICVQNFSFSAI